MAILKLQDLRPTTKRRKKFHLNWIVRVIHTIFSYWILSRLHAGFKNFVQGVVSISYIFYFWSCNVFVISFLYLERYLIQICNILNTINLKLTKMFPKRKIMKHVWKSWLLAWSSLFIPLGSFCFKLSLLSHSNDLTIHKSLYELLFHYDVASASTLNFFFVTILDTMGYQLKVIRVNLVLPKKLKINFRELYNVFILQHKSIDYVMIYFQWALSWQLIVSTLRYVSLINTKRIDGYQMPHLICYNFVKVVWMLESCEGFLNEVRDFCNGPKIARRVINFFSSQLLLPVRPWLVLVFPSPQATTFPENFFNV